MFFGKYDHQIDDRGRLRIPPVFKDELGTDFCLVCGIKGVVDIYPRKSIEEQYKALQAKLDPFSEEDQNALIDYSSGIFNATLDKQGRVALPPQIISHAGLEKDVSSIGMGDHVCLMRKDFKTFTEHQHVVNICYISKKKRV